jgi:prephenate dehydratase
MRIAIQGELGSFSHEAALKLEPQATIVPCALSPEVFQRLQTSDVAAAVIPIENSLAGSVVEHFDLLFQSDVLIESESLLRIRHNLIGVPGSQIGDVGQVLSHPIALAQCRRFFEKHPNMTPTPFYDTAGSVKHMMGRGDKEVGAIASEQAALTYGGDVLASGIEDNPANYTRFFLIRNRTQVQPVAHADKVSIAFTVDNRPGTLVAALQVFAEHNTNLCKVESRPVQGQPWQYVFYVDYQASDPGRTTAALEQLRRKCILVKELGRYQAASPPSERSSG